MTDRPFVPSVSSTALVFFAALLPRVFLALSESIEPVWDGHYYHFGAQRIAAGLGYSDDVLRNGVLQWHPWCHYPVGYSALLAIPYRIWGAGPRVGPCLNALLGAVVVALVFLLVSRIAGQVRGYVAAPLTAFSPELLLFTLLLMTEPAASLVPLAAALLVGFGVRRHRPWLGASLAGLVVGLGTLLRPQTLLGAPGLVFLLIDPAHWRASLHRACSIAAVATAVALAVVAPWTIRNCHVMDGCALVSTNAGWNLAIGSFPRATGRFETLRATDGCPIVTGHVQQDRCWASVGIFYIIHEPWRWVGLIPAKLSNTYDHSSFAAGYLAEARPHRFGGEFREVLRRLMTSGHRLLLWGAILSTMVAPWRLRGRERLVQSGLLGGALVLGLYLVTRSDAPPFWWLAVLTPLLAILPLPGRPVLGGEIRYLLFTYAALSGTHAVFFGEDRYHVFLTPTLAVLCGVALRDPSLAPWENRTIR